MTRILAVSPATKGFGFVVLEAQDQVVNRGFRTVKGEKNVTCVQEVGKMLKLYLPDLVVLENTSARDSRRSQRIQQLTGLLVAECRLKKVRVKLLSRSHVRQHFFGGLTGDKHTMATMLADRFPEDFGHMVPAKRRLWDSEDSRYNVFEAMALAVTAVAQK